MKNNILSAFLISVALVCPLSAQSGTGQTNKRSQVSIDAKTREDMVSEIKAIAMEDEEIFEKVPGFKMIKVEGERDNFVYFDGDQEAELDDLTDDALGQLFEQVTAAKKTLDDKWQERVIETSIDAQKRPPQPPRLPPRLPPQPPSPPPRR